MKKWVKRIIIVVCIACVIGISVYKYLIHKASEEISKQISQMEELAGGSNELKKLADQAITNEEITNISESAKEDKSVQATSAAAATQENQDKSSQNKGSSTVQSQNKSSNPTKAAAQKQKESTKSSFGSKQEAIRYGMSKFSISEINHFRKMASDGLTSEEKAEIKNNVFSRFSPSEITAIQKALSN